MGVSVFYDEIQGLKRSNYGWLCCIVHALLFVFAGFYPFFAVFFLRAWFRIFLPWNLLLDMQNPTDSSGTLFVVYSKQKKKETCLVSERP